MALGKKCLEKKCPNCFSPFTSEWKRDAQGQYVCPHCNTIHDMDSLDLADNSARKVENEEINHIYHLLANLKFKSADEDLRELREKYPQNAKVYFLSALSRNCICYTDSKKTPNWEYPKIPTLNDIHMEDIMQTDFVKKALQLCKTPQEQKCYSDTFEYIENVRREIVEASQNQKYQFDVFISVKVNQIDPDTDKEVLGSDGEPLKTTDYELANGLYDQIRDMIPGCRVFLSERQKALFTGKKYEHIIYSALHSSKVFILVANSSFNVESKWVRNEWMRYLYLMNDAQFKGKKSFVFVTRDMMPGDMPPEFKERECIRYGRVGAETALMNFIRENLAVKQVKKIEIKSFDTSVASMDAQALENMTLVQREWKVSYDRVTSDINMEIDDALYDISLAASLADKKEAARQRKEGFSALHRIANENEQAYRAKLYLLLEETPYSSFKQYFSSLESIAENSKFAKSFFEFADEKDAKEQINETLNAIFAQNDINPVQFITVFDVVLKPYLQAISREIAEQLSGFILSFLIKENGHEERPYYFPLVDAFLYVKRYLDGDDPKKYIECRKQVLRSIEGRPLSKQGITWVEKTAGEILDVYAGDELALWLRTQFLADATCRAVTLPDRYYRDLWNRDVSDSISVVQNKKVLALYKDLFAYAPKQSNDSLTKEDCLRVMLLMICKDSRTYKASESSRSILKPTQQGSNKDEDLNGFDLFKRFIGYDLGDKSFKGISYKFDKEKDISPNEYTFLLKENYCHLDALLLKFAVQLHRKGFYSSSIQMYEQYLAQQSSINGLDCIFVKYYIELAQNNCASGIEQQTSISEFKIARLRQELTQYARSDSEVAKLRTTWNDIARFQAEYEKTRKEVKRLLDSAPERTVENWDGHRRIAAELDKALAAIEEPQVKRQILSDYGQKIKSEQEQPAVLTAQLNSRIEGKLTDLLNHLPVKNIDNLTAYQFCKEKIYDIIGKIVIPSVRESIIQSYESALSVLNNSIYELTNAKTVIEIVFQDANREAVWNKICSSAKYDKASMANYPVLQEVYDQAVACLALDGNGREEHSKLLGELKPLLDHEKSRYDADITRKRNKEARANYLASEEHKNNVIITVRSVLSILSLVYPVLFLVQGIRTCIVTGLSYEAGYYAFLYPMPSWIGMLVSYGMCLGVSFIGYDKGNARGVIAILKVVVHGLIAIYSLVIGILFGTIGGCYAGCSGSTIMNGWMSLIVVLASAGLLIRSFFELDAVFRVDFEEVMKIAAPVLSFLSLICPVLLIVQGIRTCIETGSSCGADYCAFLYPAPNWVGMLVSYGLCLGLSFYKGYDVGRKVKVILEEIVYGLLLIYSLGVSIFHGLIGGCSACIDSGCAGCPGSTVLNGWLGLVVAIASLVMLVASLLEWEKK